VHKYVDDSQVIQSVSDGIITFSIDEFTCSLGKPQDYYGEFQIGFHECLMWHHRSHSLLLVNYSQKNLDETRIQAIKKFHVGARHGPLTHSIDQWSLVGTCIIYLDFCDSRPMLKSIHVDSLKSQKVECFSREKSVMTVPEKVVSLESNGRVITLLCEKYNDMTKVVYGWIDFSGRCTNIESFVYTSHPSYVSRNGKNNSDITGTVTEDMKYFICLEHRDDDRVDFVGRLSVCSLNRDQNRIGCRCVTYVLHGADAAEYEDPLWIYERDRLVVYTNSGKILNVIYLNCVGTDGQVRSEAIYSFDGVRRLMKDIDLRGRILYSPHLSYVHDVDQDRRTVDQMLLPVSIHGTKLERYNTGDKTILVFQDEIDDFCILQYPRKHDVWFYRPSLVSILPGLPYIFTTVGFCDCSFLW
jgi:hypothetical protein